MEGRNIKRLPPAAVKALSVIRGNTRDRTFELFERTGLEGEDAVALSNELAGLAQKGRGEKLNVIVEGALRLHEIERDLAVHWAGMGQQLADTYSPDEIRSLEDMCSQVARHNWQTAVRCAEALPALSQMSPEQMQLWTKLGARLAERNPQVARRYFSNSSRIFITEQAWPTRILELGLKLVDRDVYQVLPVMLLATLACASTPDSTHGLLLSLADDLVKTSVEAIKRLFRAAPALVKNWSVAGFRQWMAPVRRLRGQPRLLEAYMSASPGITAVIEPDDITELVDVAMRVAEKDERVAAIFLEYSDRPLRLVSTGELTPWVEAGLEMAFQSGDTGEAKDWGKAYQGDKRVYTPSGMNGFYKNDPVAQRAVAFFALHTERSREILQEVSAGVLLQAVRSPLTNFMRAMTGEQVEVSELLEGPAGRIGFSDPYRLELPGQISLYPEKPDNYAHYLLAAAHHGARIEFGGFRWLESNGGLAGESGWSGPPDFPPADMLLHDLFEIVEGYRVESRLRTEYPGLSPVLSREARRSCAMRARPESLQPAGAIVESLVRRASLGMEAGEPPGHVSGEFGECWKIIAPLADEAASVDDAWDVAKAVRGLIEEMTALVEYEGVQPVAHHGNWEFSEESRMEEVPPVDADGEMVEPGTLEMDLRELLEVLRAQGEDVSQFEAPTVQIEVELTDMESVTDMLMTRTDPEMFGGEGSDGRGKLYYYPEWDRELQDYRPGWTTLRERTITPAVDDAFYRGVIAQYRGVLAAVRRSFSQMVPQTWVKLRRQPEGDEIDIDATVEAACDIAAGVSPSDNIYTKREKRERSLAAAILVDMSGSTKESLGTKTVMEVEMEGLVVLSEALGALGDRFAIFGFSGDTRDNVDFYVVKDFEEKYGVPVHERIGGMKSMIENRDGCAIRHATRKLESVQAKTKVLLMLGDGKPVDKGYSAEYSIADTRMAIQEARLKGIHPFCITVDKQGKSYLEEMYGPSDFLIIDHIEQLPRRLPAIYRRLAV